MPLISKKICLLGDFAVGKTSLIHRFVDNQFSDQYLTTVGVKISRKTLSLASTERGEKVDLQLLIWDLEGSTKFYSIAPSHLKGASGAVIVGDLTRRETIDHVVEHIKLFLSVNPQGFMVVAYNKSDLIEAKRGVVPILQSTHFKEKDRVIATFQTSAKTGKNVDQLFEVLAQKIME
ncbi:MAG: GTP-binding protein [Nitrospira sp.]|nr:GTP-binding protein [Nitrospira sp.]